MVKENRFIFRDEEALFIKVRAHHKLRYENPRMGMHAVYFCKVYMFFSQTKFGDFIVGKSVLLGEGERILTENWWSSFMFLSQ